VSYWSQADRHVINWYPEVVRAHYGLCGPVQRVLHILVGPASKRIYHEKVGEFTGKRGMAEVVVR
jgi:hypothetical protein